MPFFKARRRDVRLTSRMDAGAGAGTLIQVSIAT